MADFLFPPLQLGGRPSCFPKQDLQSSPRSGPDALPTVAWLEGPDSPPRQRVAGDTGVEGGECGEALAGPHSSAPAAQWPGESGPGWGPWAPSGRLVRRVQG